MNPADILSRGSTVNELAFNTLWWGGPAFLALDRELWPPQQWQAPADTSEEKKIKSILVAGTDEDDWIGRISHRNSLEKWLRIIGYCRKLGPKMLDNGEKLGHFSPREREQALTDLIRYAQRQAFRTEIKQVQEGKTNQMWLKSFTPILDADGILRVGGRLQAADLSFEQQHPAILPYGHEVTRLIAEHMHRNNKHAGPQALLAILRQRYWPLKGKILATTIVHNCVLCARAKPRLLQQVMGDLPRERVTPARCFLTTGIDMAGPITIHATGRGIRTKKGYICVFVCFSTKAIHLEVAEDLSTEAFLHCLKRFVARRGAPQKIFCDNGTNFRGAYNELAALARELNAHAAETGLSRFCAQLNIKWHFIPPRSPHFGGLWEAAVKSAKGLLLKAIHARRLTHDELNTYIAEIEAILNSRPLTAMSDNPQDLQPLTAGHFLIGEPMTAIPNEHFAETSKLRSWAKITAMRNEFWQRWSREYLCELQQKHKWRANAENIKCGTMVTLKDSNLAPLQWNLGRVTDVLPGPSGVVRVVQVQTAMGNFKRAIHEIAPLPVEEYPFPANKQSKKRLDPDATAFVWKNKDSNLPVTDTKPKRERRRHHQPDPPTTSGPEKTRSGRTYGRSILNNTILFTLMLLGFFACALGTPCKIQTFSHNPGLHYERVGKMSLTTDEWTLLCHMDMDHYWKEPAALHEIAKYMEKIYSVIPQSAQCEAVVLQFTGQLKVTSLAN